MACVDGEGKVTPHDDIDGDIHMLMSQTQKRLSDSTETDSDSETEMTVIRPKLNRKMRLGSNQSYGSYGKKLHTSCIISGHCSTAMAF